MARLEKNQFDEAGINPFNAPVPGESLTTSPDTPKSWERPPQFTNEDDAMVEIYLRLTERDKLKSLINIIDDGIPLDEIAQVVLYKGYTEGQFNPDLMMLLIEPTIYLLISIADYADIKDYVLYEGEEDDSDTTLPDDDIEPIDMDGDGIADKIKPSKEIKEPTEDSVSASLLSRIKEELPSKIEKIKPEEKEQI
tara:strand:+ start:984 stop:1568 length:585 start_codon:yes stop_codon:yes gene_type:complete